MKSYNVICYQQIISLMLLQNNRKGAGFSGNPQPLAIQAIAI